MTRESIPRFDLYAELEVSRLASVEVIEAAYRTLAKRNHPDVSSPDDPDRIKRLNMARTWLSDPTRRRRYDNATAPVVSAANGGGDWRAAPEEADSGAPNQSFGVNGNQVREFLAELRGIDANRARQVWKGMAFTRAEEYEQARKAAVAAARAHRHGQWLFAREAASVIARGKLGDSTLTDQVLDVVVDVAGAIVIRDLIPPSAFGELLLPWMWRPEPSGSRKAAAARRNVASAAPAAAAAAVAAAGAVAGAAQGANAAVRAGAEARAAAGSQAASDAMAGADARAGADPRASAEPWPTSDAWTNTAAATNGAEPMNAAAEPETAAATRTGAFGTAAFGSAAVGTAAAATAQPSARTAPVVRDRSKRPSSLRRQPAILGLIAVVAIVAVVLALNAPGPDLATASESPTATGPLTGLGSPLASQTFGETPQDSGPSTGPSGTEPSTVPTDVATPGQTPAPGATPRPTLRPTPKPTTAPTPGPTLHPTPPGSPGPTATPRVFCDVINLINVNSANAQLAWTNADFTGTVLFSPATPPHWKIAWQSLTVGTTVLCTSNISVQQVAP